MSPTPPIDRGSLQKFRQALSRLVRPLEVILAIRGGYRPGQYKARLAFALALSLLIHVFVLSLRFGIAGFGLPGLAVPWAERRAFSSDLSVRLAEAPRAQTPSAAPGKRETVRRPSAVEPLAVPPPAVQPPAVRPNAVRPPRTFVARTPVTTKRTKRRQPRAKAPAVARAATMPLPAVAAPKPAEQPAREPAMQPKAQPEIIAQTEPEQETFSVPPPAPGATEPAPEVTAKQQVEEPPPPATEQAAPAREQALADEEAARRARDEEAARLEQARRQEEARRQDEARAAREALELEALGKAERQAEEAAKQQAAALARQREEMKRQEEELVARERAAQELAARQRAEALAASQRQREAERLAADRAASRAPLAVAEPGRSAAGTIGPPLSGRELAAKALEQLRTPGAARAEPQGPPRPSPQAPESSLGAERSRRGSVFGSAGRDIGLKMYVESWRWKIERNGNLNYPSSARTRAAENPVVTVAIRRDGSVEGVVIHRSSGLRDLDERVRRIVQLYAPYSAFPPDLARAYDVIEIRLVWIFADTLRIVEELR